jgi:hypothetical protein
MDKSRVLKAIIDKVRDELERHERAAGAAIEGATGDEVKSESKYDTRSTEASYLARGHSLQFAEVAEDFRALDGFSPMSFEDGTPSGLGALIDVELEGERSFYFILPRAGGTEVEIEEDGRTVDVTAVTLDSPISSRLVGRIQGDIFSIREGGALGEIMRVI